MNKSRQRLVDEAPSLENIDDRMKVGGHLVNAVRFADNHAMVANTIAGVQRIMDGGKKTTEEFGMRINIKQTKVMRISKNEAKQLKISIDGYILEQEKQFCYLGSIITDDSACHTEIKRRIAMGKTAFAKKKNL